MSFGVPIRNGLNLGLPSTLALASQFPYEGLITPGAISPLFTFARAQPSGSVATGNALWTWQTYAADAPRFVQPTGGLLIEGQRTNGISAPRQPGGTGWTLTNIASVTSITGPDGVAGTATTINEGVATGTHIIQATIPSVYNTPHTLSVLLRPGTCNRARLTFGGSAFGTGVAVSVLLSGAGSITATGASVTQASITVTDGWYRVQVTGSTLASGSTFAQVRMLSAAGGESYTGTNRTLDVAWPQSEANAPFASTPILPPADTPGASTRSNDLAPALLSSLNVGGNGACTVLWSGQFIGLGPTSTQRLVVIDDGTDANRIGFQQQAGNALRLFRTTASADETATDSTVAAVGASLRIGVSITGDGRAAASVNGGVPIVVTGAPTSGLTTLRVGNDASGSAPMFGTVTRCVVLPFALSDADLQAVVSSLPSP